MNINNRKYTVYEHIFPNGMRYVGITSMRPEERWNNGKQYKAVELRKAINFYGWDCIQHKILYTGLTKDDAIEKEKELIAEYRATCGTYNIGDGGDLGSLPSAQFILNGEILSAGEIAQLSDDDITAHDITTRVNHHGWDLDEAMHRKKMNKNQMFEYNSILYSAKELAAMSSVEGITEEHILSRINKHGWDVERAITQPIGEKIQKYVYEYNGQLYTPTQLAKLAGEGITEDDIRNRIEYNGWAIEDALKKPKKHVKKLHEYNGELYTTKELLKKYCVDPKIKNTHLFNRLRIGWTLEEALSIPLGEKRKQ